MATLPRVFVSRPLPAEALRLLEGRAQLTVGPDRASLSADELAQGMRGADAVVSMLNDRIDAPLLREAGRLKVVANYAVGFNNVDFKAAEELGIWVTNTPGAVTEATADAAMGLLIASARMVPQSELLLRQGKFGGWTPTHCLGGHVSGATLGIVGMGRIGQAVAKRAQGFSMRVIYFSRNRLSPERELALGVSHCGLDTLLAESDFISLHCPLNEQTRHLIDAAALARMKPTAYLINTSRGPVVDEPALARALTEGRIAGAGIDVYEDEPKVHPALLAAPNAVLTPHIGTSTLQTRLAMARLVVADLARIFDGQEPINPVNRPVRPRSFAAA